MIRLALLHRDRDGEVHTPVTLVRRKGLWYLSENPGQPLAPSRPAAEHEH